MTVGFSIRTTNQDGTMPFHLDALAPIGDLEYSSSWGGGPLTATWTMNIDVHLDHYALTPGRIVHIYDGITQVWRGYLTDPQRGAPWTINAAGLQALGQNYAAIDAAGDPTAEPNVAVNRAIARGLPWTINANLPAPFPATIETALSTSAAVGATIIHTAVPISAGSSVTLEFSGTSTTTVNAAVTAGQASIRLAAAPPLSSTLLISGTAGNESVIVTSVTGTGPYTVGITPVLRFAHAVGDTVNYVVGEGETVQAITSGTNPTLSQPLTNSYPPGASVYATGVTQTGSVADLLNLVSDSVGLQWAVDRHGLVTMPTPPTTPDYICVGTDTPGGRTVDNYATDLYGFYYDAAFTGQPTVHVVHVATTNPTSSGPNGRYEQIVDLTPRGPISTAAALLILQGMLNLVGARAWFTGSITVQPGALLTPGGVPVRLSTVRAGKLVRFIGVIPDPALGELTYSSSVDVLIGDTDYTASTDLLQLSPVNSTQRDLSSLLTVTG